MNCMQSDTNKSSNNDDAVDSRHEISVLNRRTGRQGTLRIDMEQDAIDPSDEQAGFHLLPTMKETHSSNSLGSSSRSGTSSACGGGGGVSLSESSSTGKKRSREGNSSASIQFPTIEDEEEPSSACSKQKTLTPQTETNDGESFTKDEPNRDITDEGEWTFLEQEFEIYPLQSDEVDYQTLSRYTTNINHLSLIDEDQFSLLKGNEDLLLNHRITASFFDILILFCSISWKSIEIIFSFFK